MYQMNILNSVILYAISITFQCNPHYIAYIRSLEI